MHSNRSVWHRFWSIIAAINNNHECDLLQRGLQSSGCVHILSRAHCTDEMKYIAHFETTEDEDYRNTILLPDHFMTDHSQSIDRMRCEAQAASCND